jgi:hypothetical protein
VNAGATRPADIWLDRLNDGGRLILPLTSDKSFGENPENIPIQRRGAVFCIERLARPLMELLRADGDLVMGENEPYRVTDLTDYTVPVHAERRGLPYVELEIRQDLIAEPAGQQEWASRLARLLPAAWAQMQQR